MSIQLVTSFIFYCFISGITPGPANLTSLYAALNYGKGPALRQWRGLFCGFFCDAIMAALLSFFIGSALGDYVKYLGWIGAAYIIWLAIHILRSNLSPSGDGSVSEAAGNDSGDGSSKDGADRCTFRRGLFVQLTNVKVIIFCITALSSYILPVYPSLPVLLLVACFLPFTGPMCNLVWLFAGVKLQKLFENHRKAINIVMAAALILCAFSLINI